jgi:hypothetical protein
MMRNRVLCTREASSSSKHSDASGGCEALEQGLAEGYGGHAGVHAEAEALVPVVVDEAATTHPRAIIRRRKSQGQKAGDGEGW